MGFSRPLSALVSLFHGGPLLPFELLATRLLPSSFIFLYTFSSILLPSPASSRLCAGPSFFSSVLLSFSTSVVPALGAVTCAWCICTLVISPVPNSLSWMCLLIICGFGFFSASFTAFSSLVCLLPFSLWLLVLYVCSLSCLSWPFLLLFLHCGLLRVFFSLCSTISFPLSFFRLGMCARLWCLPLSLYLFTLPRPLRWFSLRGLPLCSS